jgi:hypothetical protein
LTTSTVTPPPLTAAKRPPRRNSREVPAVPASQYPTELAQEIWRWINQREREEDTYYQGLPRHAEKIGISHDKLRRYAMGVTRQPSREDCHLLAAYFHVNEDYVLRRAGYETYGTLGEAARMVMPDRPDLAEALRLTDTPLWRGSPAPEKASADRMLAGGAPIETKVVLIADAVRAWHARLSKDEKEALRAQLARSAGA